MNSYRGCSADNFTEILGAEKILSSLPLGALPISPIAARHYGAGEHELLGMLREIASENRVFRSYIGQGYHDVIVPGVIQRNQRFSVATARDSGNGGAFVAGPGGGHHGDGLGRLCGRKKLRVTKIS